MTKALKGGRVRSDIVDPDYRGPTPAHDGFRGMVRESAFDAGELEANRKGLQLAIDRAMDQKILPRRLTVDELFDDVSGSLG